MNKITSSLFILSIVMVFLIGVVWQKIEVIKNDPGNSQKEEKEKTNLMTGKMGDEAYSKIVPVSEFDHVRGDRDSKVKIIEYLDLECKFCKEFYETAQREAVKYGGEVSIVFRHYPLDGIHPDARKKAEASECVAQIGRNESFFEFVDIYFKEVPYDADFDIDLVTEIAKRASVNPDDFKKCIDGSETANIVEGQFQGGLTAGVRGTPQGFIVNDKGNAWLIPETLPAEQVRTLINEALK